MGPETKPEVKELSPERLALLLRVLRKVHRFSMRALSEEVGVSHSYIALLEGGGIDPRSGKRINPQPDTLKRLGDRLSGSYLILMDAAGYLPDDVIISDPFANPELVRVREKVERELGQDIFLFLGRKSF